jgi:hypothetical protein
MVQASPILSLTFEGWELSFGIFSMYRGTETVKISFSQLNLSGRSVLPPAGCP